MAAAMRGGMKSGYGQSHSEGEAVRFELAEEDVEFVRMGIRGCPGSVEVPVDLPRYRHTLRFHVESQAPAL